MLLQSDVIDKRSLSTDFLTCDLLHIRVVVLVRLVSSLLCPHPADMAPHVGPMWAIFPAGVSVRCLLDTMWGKVGFIRGIVGPR